MAFCVFDNNDKYNTKKIVIFFNGVAVPPRSSLRTHVKSVQNNDRPNDLFRKMLNVIQMNGISR